MDVNQMAAKMQGNQNSAFNPNEKVNYNCSAWIAQWHTTPCECNLCHRLTQNAGSHTAWTRAQALRLSDRSLGF